MLGCGHLNTELVEYFLKANKIGIFNSLLILGRVKADRGWKGETEPNTINSRNKK